MLHASPRSEYLLTLSSPYPAITPLVQAVSQSERHNQKKRITNIRELILLLILYQEREAKNAEEAGLLKGGGREGGEQPQ